MSKLISSGLPCSNCGSSDALALYDDDHTFCFSCSKVSFPNEKKKELVDLEIADTYRYDKFRGVPDFVMEKYNACTGYNTNGEPLEVYYSYVNSDPSNTPVGKRRLLQLNEKGRKVFLTEGDINKVGLYGKHVHDPGSKKSITIFEGEQDALTGDYVVGDQSACVSVQSASTARRDCDADRDYINSFDKIIFWFDNDTPGRTALEKCVPLFDFNKVFVVSDTKYKDANEYLLNDQTKELNAAWRAAKRYTPDGIISTFSEIEAALATNKEACIGTYPFEILQNNLFGLHRGEVVVLKAPEGIGKTETFRAMEHHLLKTTDCRIGIIHLEEDDGTTVKAIATYELGVPCVLPDTDVTDKEIFDAYVKAVDGREDRVFIHSHFGADDPDIILDNIRFLTTSCGCDFIFLDHITMLVTGHSDDGDERRKLDYISTRLKLMAKELGFCLIMISHVNDDGQTRGSRNITKIANTVVHIDRDKVNPDPVMRNTTFYTIEKARLGGRTGPGGKVYFDMETYNMREFNAMDYKPKELKGL